MAGHTQPHRNSDKLTFTNGMGEQKDFNVHSIGSNKQVSIRTQNYQAKQQLKNQNFKQMTINALTN